MCPPIGSPLKSKCISMYFPNRDELSFLFVFAFPNASSMEFDWIRTFFTLSISFLPPIIAINMKFYILLNNNHTHTLICYCRYVLHNNFGSFRFSRSWFSTDDNAGVLSLFFHHSVCSIGNSKNVRWVFK